jgi:hypothetical protein
MIHYNKNEDGKKKPTITFKPFSFYGIFSLMTAMIGYHIHDSIFWSIIDFIFSPLAWMKWIIFHEVNITIIKETFSFFLQ